MKNHWHSIETTVKSRYPYTLNISYSKPNQSHTGPHTHSLPTQTSPHTYTHPGRARKPAILIGSILLRLPRARGKNEKERETRARAGEISHHAHTRLAESGRERDIPSRRIFDILSNGSSSLALGAASYSRTHTLTFARKEQKEKDSRACVCATNLGQSREIDQLKRNERCWRAREP